MDCSTFSFDLHVLGAPPALILSRDQTLIVYCEFAKSPRLTQSTDEFFFTASNQIVKDLRAPFRNCERPDETQASKLIGHKRLLQAAWAIKLGELDKEPNRKAVFRPNRWPGQSFVTVPCRGSFPFITQPRYGCKHSQSALLPIPNWATS